MRLDTYIRCFQTINALKRRYGVTAKELQCILGCSLKTAYRYLDSASIALPVMSEGYPARYRLVETDGVIGGVEYSKTGSHNRRIARAVYGGMSTF